ncbi:hypothetical protein ANN_16118 [Periplaneta americana]|uniref:HTH CENPB-type domain-containing protein n=1 Tax=Periplaneta americana TaxID=6978 RepID=A0ABQ8SJC6_PERAM|nr:hypothetical protein ANN_16118 [Periplaneta americana]
MFYGLTRRSVMQLAYEIAEKNKLATWFNKETKSAGKEWFSGFMKRHPELSLRQPEATSLARASGFNRVVVGKFFDTLEQLVDQHKLTAARIFNMDETSHTVVQRQEKILAQRGKYQLNGQTSSLSTPHQFHYIPTPSSPVTSGTLTYLLAFKEPGGSLLPSHKPAIGPYPEQD